MNEKERWDYVREEMRAEPLTLSPKISHTIRNTEHGLLFILARYKFPLKMLLPKKRLKVLDLGCNDGLGDLMIFQDCDCEQVVGVDFDEAAIAWAQKNIATEGLSFRCEDFMGIDVYPLGGGRCYLSRCHRAYSRRARGRVFHDYLPESEGRWHRHHRHAECDHGALFKSVEQGRSHQQLRPEEAV